MHDLSEDVTRSVVTDNLSCKSRLFCIVLHKIQKVLFCVQIQDEDLAQSLGLSTGKYLIKQSASADRKPKKAARQSLRDKRSTTRPKDSSTNAGDAENLCDSDEVIQASDLDELMDTQKMIEFAITSANPKDIGSDFEPAQMLPSNYLEGPVVKIEEFPSNMPGISDGSSAAEDEVLLCYMAQSASDLPVISDSTDQNLSFKQPSMVTAAPVMQSSTLTFPLTLTVDGSTIDSCSGFQFS